MKLVYLVIFFPMILCSKEVMKYKKLSKEEERVIVHKGTEAPFSGTYNDFDQPGGYHCKRCEALLYRSEDKFSSSCGWPSFDDEVKGAISRKRDADGRRVEILCARCDAHLGHVFEGEGFTSKNVRHCVNSISMTFLPASQMKKSVAEQEEGSVQSPVPEEYPVKEALSQAYFAGGCFWGVEYLFEQKKGVHSATSGYMGGNTKNPTYQDVCTGKTGHIEVVEVIYDVTQVSYEELAKFFFEIHDPTQLNAQGPDHGTQYQSAVFVRNPKEKETIQKLIQILNQKGEKAVTKVYPVSEFWKAEEGHQNYYQKTKKRPYCHAYKKKFD